MTSLHEAFTAGYTSLSAWSDLLDRINVFPVADADTGANLRISLSPLRTCSQDREQLANRIIHAATGNSGNIAAAFFSILVKAHRLEELAQHVGTGYNKAREAIADPKEGTMLSVFATLATTLSSCPRLTATSGETVLGALQQSVLDTTQIQDRCRQAGVVDAGALGMYIFFDAFFRSLLPIEGAIPSLFTLFPGRLSWREGYQPPASAEYCVDLLLTPSKEGSLDATSLSQLGESLVMVPKQTSFKIHIHTPDPQKLQRQLTDLGEVGQFSAEPLYKEQSSTQMSLPPGSLHIMTDAAGSLPRYLAQQYGISLLDSYIIHGDRALPESLWPPEDLYRLMRQQQRLTTAQASLAERHQRYQSVCEEFGKTLYLCVGSAFTGNYEVASALQKKQQSLPLTIIDTGAASGRLGLMALLCARLAQRTDDAEAVTAYARGLIQSCREYVFIDTLHYLVAGGRLSRTSGLFGNLLGLKPVISPTPEGVKKMGVVRSQHAQLNFALNKLQSEISRPESGVLLLQYSDNETWVEETVQPALHQLLPEAEILRIPLSLTSGVHMGPGTWSLAFAESI
nr:DegV family protein [uncultured Desulfobulbus sp.]